MSNDIDPHITERYEIKRRLGKGVSCIEFILIKMLDFPVIAPPSANSEGKPKTFAISSRNHPKQFFLVKLTQNTPFSTTVK